MSIPSSLPEGVDPDKTWTELYKGKSYIVWHGCPFDRGMSDSWYSRPCNPHYWPQDSLIGKRVGIEDMTEEEIEAYRAGYAFNEELGGKKVY
jgi:hypothetical protein